MATAVPSMRCGDALQLDGEVPHGPVRLSGLPVRFLSVTAYGPPDGQHHERRPRRMRNDGSGRLDRLPGTDLRPAMPLLADLEIGLITHIAVLELGSAARSGDRFGHAA